MKKIKNKKVVITVSGGVAEVRKCPRGLDIQIIDFDNIKSALEEIRHSLNSENVCITELCTLQRLSDYIDPSDVQLLEAAGIPEFGIGRELQRKRYEKNNSPVKVV